MKIASLEEIYEIDEDKSLNGVEYELGLNVKNEPIILIIAEMGNEKNQKVMRKYDKALETCRHNKKKRQMVWAKIIAESILLDWSGMLDTKKKEVPATMENKIETLIEYEGLFLDIMEASQDKDRFRPDNDDINPEEDSEKNLKNTSDGTWGTGVS